ncbi:TenA family transcriptional regulator [Legionella lytica]|uniref:TenA family transcriptional regulator n=1 Tax=Legionella lytica TaxID=96232 RepID=A0ABW8DBZ9_9GAMM
MDQLIEHILREMDYLNNPYFVHLKNGTFDKNDFVETQIQFYSAVDFFARPMAALVSKIPCPELRLGVLRNVWEEHGEGDSERFHKFTFLTFLQRLDGCTFETVKTRTLWPELRIFNTTLDGVCNSDNYLLGVGAMGIIEKMFSNISSFIGRNVVERGWLVSSQLIHYDLHEELDIKHAEDFFSILRASWNTDPASRNMVEQGLRLGATLFYGLYEGLYRARNRRWIQGNQLHVDVKESYLPKCQQVDLIS